MINDPAGDGKVRIIRAVRGPHPNDGHEVIAIVVEDGLQQRRRVLLKLTNSNAHTRAASRSVRHSRSPDPAAARSAAFTAPPHPAQGRSSDQ